jgi:hypothetical protein
VKNRFQSLPFKRNLLRYTTAEAFYDEAVGQLCGGCWRPVVELAAHLPCEAQRSELLAVHARREFGGA